MSETSSLYELEGKRSSKSNRELYSRHSQEHIKAFQDSRVGKPSIYTRAQQFMGRDEDYERPPLAALDLQIDRFCAIVHCSLSGQLDELSQFPTEAVDKEFINTYESFTITKFLGRGQAGTVFLAEDDNNNPLFAVKIIHLPNAVGVGLPIRRTFLSYQKLLKFLEFPFINRYIGWTVFDNQAQVYTDYCPDGSLSRLIQSSGGLRLPKIKQFIGELVYALLYIHSHGIVHRDLKPGNILLKDGHCRITDFGSARIQQACCENPHQRKLSGTANYCAPESVKGEFLYESAGEDIWGLGCCLYEMVIAKEPWHFCDNTFAVYFQLGNLKDSSMLVEEVENQNILDEDGLDFLKLCLEIDVKKRVTSHELTKHPFVTRPEILRDRSADVF